MKMVFEHTVANFDTEDAGMARIMEIDSGEGRMFVRIQSWDETKEHPEMEALNGRHVRVTVEVIND